MKNLWPISFLRRKQIYELLGQFLETGVPVDTALKSVLNYYPSGYTGRIMAKLAHEFEQKQHLAEALDCVLGPLPIFEKLAFQSAESQGHLGKAIDKMAQILSTKEEFLKDILENLQGPTLTLHTALLLYLGMEYFSPNPPPFHFLALKACFFLIILWSILFFVGRRIISALNGESDGPTLPFFSHLNINMAQYQMILSYQGLLEAGIARLEIHSGILASLPTGGPYQVNAKEAFSLIEKGSDSTPSSNFLAIQEWAEWAMARKSGKESEILLKISEKLKKKLERNFRQYFTWANRILRVSILILIGLLIYKMNVDRLQGLQDLDTNP